MSKRIAFLSPVALEVYGGREKWIIDVANYFSKKYDVYVFAPKWTGHEKYRLTERELLNIILFHYKKILKVKKFRSFYDIDFISGYFDVIYLTDFVGFKIYPLKIKKESLIIGNHSLFAEQKGKSYYLKKLIISLESPIIREKEQIKIHVINSWQRLFYLSRGYPNRRIYLIQNFVYSSKYHYPQSSDRFTVLFLGRIGKHKGIDLLPGIIKDVLEKNNNIFFWIAGSGEKYYEKKLKELEKNYPENVRYFGFISEDEKNELLSRASLFLLPSRFEGQPIAILESLVSGTPFVGSNIISFWDLIHLYGKEFGWIVKEYHPKAFAEKILDIYKLWNEHPREYFEKRKIISKKAREIFDINNVLKVFDQLLIKNAYD